jgi:hypothetical protein
VVRHFSRHRSRGINCITSAGSARTNFGSDTSVATVEFIASATFNRGGSYCHCRPGAEAFSSLSEAINILDTPNYHNGVYDGPFGPSASIDGPEGPSYRNSRLNQGKQLTRPRKVCAELKIVATGTDMRKCSWFFDDVAKIATF